MGNVDWFWSGSGRGEVAVCSEHCNVASFSVKFGGFIDKLRSLWLVRKDSASCITLILCFVLLDEEIRSCDT
jgi:hypothetical protein